MQLGKVEIIRKTCLQCIISVFKNKYVNKQILYIKGEEVIK